MEYNRYLIVIVVGLPLQLPVDLVDLPDLVKEDVSGLAHPLPCQLPLQPPQPLAHLSRYF